MSKNVTVAKGSIKALLQANLPSGIRFSQDAESILAKAITVFVSSISNLANTTSSEQSRKTIIPEDISDACNKLGFSSFLKDTRVMQMESAEKQSKTKLASKRMGKKQYSAEMIQEQKALLAKAKADFKNSTPLQTSISLSDSSPSSSSSLIPSFPGVESSVRTQQTILSGGIASPSLQKSNLNSSQNPISPANTSESLPQIQQIPESEIDSLPTIPSFTEFLQTQ
ncbi:uncharacterized protein MONOS_5665 [Monocercomonoides exilis]|uniref:uncharacterized protein n=1 Tax=Monocercomonoides exilis TaxID=2049356 RepID=UPI0035599D5A|nr:hypothetical protein MONOS_5665 [Monocercomonoides exilis]|eukprot:MONOS_5665.1-p1 / transcript=MONOS_5665.1 / gene=MONOS_5665 / organism=Monocercomonoides_exilis_PA203 / gene_product=unspecified product / transcript_product=unspecified product / location=Mono_scaffold00167:98150-99112(+) / protein_length=225 / sequence_SO=supercontig / SO=protein_coding / is_pseudo=false